MCLIHSHLFKNTVATTHSAHFYYRHFKFLQGLHCLESQEPKVRQRERQFIPISVMLSRKASGFFPAHSALATSLLSSRTPLSILFCGRMKPHRPLNLSAGPLSHPLHGFHPCCDLDLVAWDMDQPSPEPNFHSSYFLKEVLPNPPIYTLLIYFHLLVDTYLFAWVFK